MDENRTCDVRAVQTYAEFKFNSLMRRSQPCETMSHALAVLVQWR
jgi:hypothetical protein